MQIRTKENGATLSLEVLSVYKNITLVCFKMLIIVV